MKVKIRFSDGSYKYLENPSKRKVSSLISRLGNKSGICRVEYTTGFFNDFLFNGASDFKDKIEPCLEEELLKDFCKG